MRAIAERGAPAEEGTHAASSLNVSPSPDSAEGDGVETSASSARPAESVMRLPAKFPLSTDET